MIPRRQLINTNIQREPPLILQVEQIRQQPHQSWRRHILEVISSYVVLKDQDFGRGFLIGTGEREVEDVVVGEAVADGFVGFGDWDVRRTASVEDGVERGWVVAEGVDCGV